MQVRVNLSTPTYFIALCQRHESKLNIDVSLSFLKTQPFGGKISPMRCPEGETACADDWVLEVSASTSDIVITQ